jgi:hypothetical protein
MPEEEDQAIGTLLGFLAGGNAWTDGAGQASGTATAELADLVAQLEPEPDDERGTLDAITDLLDTGTASKAAALVAQLDPGDKRRARRALLALLTHHTTGAGLASKVAALVALLDPEPDEKRETLEVVLTLLRSQTGGLACADMATTVLQLDPEPGDKSRARRALIALLTSYANGAVAADEAMLWRLADNDKGSLTAKLVALVIQLHPTPGDKRRALNVVLTLLEGQATDAAAVSLAAMMAQLDPTPGDKRRALDAVLKLLDDPATDAAAVRQVVNLVRPDLLADHTEGRDADGLAATLIQLDPTPGDKHQARLALLRRLTKSDHPWTASQLADDLTRLDATAEEKHRACEALLGRLKGRPWLVSVVVQLASTPGDKRQVLDALLCLLDLEETGSGAAGQLIDGMAQLDPTALDLSRSRRWAALPTRELLAAVRRNSSLDEWLEVLPLIAAGS